MPIEIGQVSISTSGTPVNGPATPIANFFLLSLVPPSTGTAWVARSSGAATSTGGYPLQLGAHVTLPARTLSELWFGGSSDGLAVAWIKLH